MRARDDGLLSLDDPIGRFPRRVRRRDRTSACSPTSRACRTDPSASVVGWLRQGCGSIELLAADDAPCGGGELLHYSNPGLGAARRDGVASRAPWWDVVAAESQHSGWPGRRTTPSGPHVSRFTEVLADEPSTRGMAPAQPGVEHRGQPGALADFLRHGRPDVLAPETLTESRSRPTPATAGAKARGQRRSAAGRAGSMPGFLASVLPRHPHRQCGADQRDRPGWPPRPCPGSAARRPRAARRAIRTVGLPEVVAGVPGLWFWATPPRRCADTMIGCGCSVRDRRCYEFEVGDRMPRGCRRGETLFVRVRERSPSATWSTRRSSTRSSGPTSRSPADTRPDWVR